MLCKCDLNFYFIKYGIICFRINIKINLENIVLFYIMTDKNIPVIASIGNSMIDFSGFRVEFYADHNLILSTSIDIDVVVWITKPKYRDILRLRRDPRFLFCLMFSTAKKIDARSQELLDGNVEPHQWYSMWQEWLQLSHHYINIKKVLTNREKVALYLSLRPDYQLSAVLDITHFQLYSFPLVELISESKMSANRLLKEMVRNNLLVSDGIIDRLRLCQCCSNAHINYIDICPQCGDIDLEQEIAIHCFTCGHVEIQSLFLNDHKLICPSCTTVLRHIGVDYDRPLESLRCKSCRAFFSEGEVIARCLACGHHQKPEDLKVFPIYNYHVTEQGRLLALGKEDENLDMYLGVEVSLKHFYWQTDWCLKLLEREGTPFCLFSIHFKGLNYIINKVGEEAASLLLETIADRFRSTSRSTDLLCRLNNETFIKLLPATEIEDINSTTKKLTSIIEKIEIDGGNYFDIEIYHLEGTRKKLPGISAKKLIASLLENKGGFHDH